MIKKLRNQPYAPKWEQEEEKKTMYILAKHRFHRQIIATFIIIILGFPPSESR
jgi:hypothetical protein